MQHSNHSIIISIRDLGYTIHQIRAHWHELLATGKPIQIAEFPGVDFTQTIFEGQSLMSLILDMMDTIQEQKRIAVRQRQAAGIQRARDKGIRLGRRPLDIPLQFETVCERIDSGKLSVTAASRELGVDYKTVKKWLKDREGEEA